MRRPALLVGALLCVSACGSESTVAQGRVSSIGIFESPEVARAAGCRVVGPKAGTAFSNLALLSGGFDPALESQDGNAARLVTLAEAHMDEEHAEWFLYDGRQKGVGRYASVGEPTTFNSEFSDGWLRARAPSVVFPLPALDDYLLDPPLSLAAIEGQPQATPEGLVFEGIIHGYLKIEDVRATIARLYIDCEREEQPAVCELAYSQLPPNPDEATFTEYVLTFIGAPDTRAEGDTPSTCTDDCNAYGLCFGLTLAPQPFSAE